MGLENIRFITAQAPEYAQIYAQICDLRYRVFFAAHQLPFETVFDAQEAASLHAIYSSPLAEVLLTPPIEQSFTLTAQPVLAYGRLTPNPSGIYQISQMAVEPRYQRQGLGQAILQALIERADAEQAKMLTLNARLSAVPFYQRFGFVTVGQPFASAKTGLLHIEMQLLKMCH
jgi:predicted GNAT family N-acyltransferase